MLKLLNLDPVGYSEKAYCLLSEHAEIDDYNGIDELSDIIACYDILLLRFSKKINRSILEKAKNLKIIACNATGVDHIDEVYADDNGIRIISLKNETAFLEGIHATAELTWGLLLSLVRKIPNACMDVVKGNWDRDQFIANELYDKRIGILGYGRIGKKVARYANAFGMKVFAYDINDKEYESYVKKVDSIHALCSTSDILSIHIPFNSSTDKLINKNLLQKMPDGAYIINTSRGAIIDESDLVVAINSGVIAGAAVDVLSKESDNDFLPNNSLFQYAQSHSNLIITPHIGGVTKESWEKTEFFIADKIVNHIKKNIHKPCFGT